MNVVYSYAVIVETAVAISKHESWLTTEKIQASHIGRKECCIGPNYGEEE